MERSSQMEKTAAGIVIALLAAGSVMILEPFLPAVIWAAIFAISSWPLFTRIEAGLGGRRGMAAGIVISVFIGIFLIPVGFVGMELADQASRVTDLARAAIKGGVPPLPAWVGTIPLVGTTLTSKWAELAIHTPDMATIIEPYLSKLLGMLLAAGASIGKTLVLLLLSLVILFFFLKEGSSIAASLDRMAVRLGGDRGLRLLHLSGTTMSSVVYGTLGAAMVQGILASAGLWAADVPGWLILGFGVFVLGLIPAGLTAIILLPAAGWLFYSGQPGWGIFMIIWTIVVGNVDNYIRPLVISRGAQIPFIIVFLGVLGGVATGGILGLFIGPTVLGVFHAFLVEWSESADPAFRTGATEPHED